MMAHYRLPEDPGDDQGTTEQDYHDLIDKKDQNENLEVFSFDLRPHASELFNSHLP